VSFGPCELYVVFYLSYISWRFPLISSAEMEAIIQAAFYWDISFGVVILLMKDRMPKRFIYYHWSQKYVLLLEPKGLFYY